MTKKNFGEVKYFDLFFHSEHTKTSSTRHLDDHLIEKRFLLHLLNYIGVVREISAWKLEL